MLERQTHRHALTQTIAFRPDDFARQPEAVSRRLKAQSQRNLALGTGTRQQTLELLVVVAVESHARPETGRHLLRKEPVAHGTIDAETLQLALVIDEAQPVAIGKRRRARHIERVAAQLLDLAHILAHGLRRVGRKDVRLPAVQEVGGEATVESLVQPGRKRIADAASRSTAVAVCMGGDKRIELLTVGGNDVLDIRHILQPALNLERRGTGLYQFTEVSALVQVFQRQQVALVLQLAAVGIKQVELHAAELRTRTTVGRTAKAVLRGIAQAAIADTQGTMDKNLQRHVGHLGMNVCNLVDGQFTRQHRTAKTLVAKPPHLVGCPVVGLRRGMKGYRRQVQLQDTHILNQNGIHTRLVELVYQLPGSLQLVIIDNGIDGYENLHRKLVGILTKPADVVKAIARRSPGTEARRPDIYRISTMVDGSHAALQVLGGCQQFQLGKCLLMFHFYLIWLISYGVS